MRLRIPRAIGLISHCVYLMKYSEMMAPKILVIWIHVCGGRLDL